MYEPPQNQCVFFYIRIIVKRNMYVCWMPFLIFLLFTAYVVECFIFIIIGSRHVEICLPVFDIKSQQCTTLHLLFHLSSFP